MDTLTLLFDWMLAAGLRASLLTMVVLALQGALRHYLSAGWRYALWMPVLIVTLTPVFPESSWGVISVSRWAPAATPSAEISTIGETERNAQPVPTSSVSEAGSAETAPLPWRSIIIMAWSGGVVAVTLFGLAAYARTLWRIRKSLLPVEDTLRDEVRALALAVGLKRSPRVWMSPAIPSPAVTGLLRPTLLLPKGFEQRLTKGEARHVIKHELMHLKRCDLPVHALVCLLVALHWFNPLLWLAFFRVRLDRELACDAQVLVRESQAMRVAYGHTLLRVETIFSQHGFSLGFVGIFQRGAALRARIHSIASPPNSSLFMKAASSLALAVMTFLGVTQAATPGSNPDPKQPGIYISTKFIEIRELESAEANPVPLPSLLGDAHEVPGMLGTLTDPQFQVVIRALSQRKGVDLLSAPSVLTRSGQRALIEVVREFIHPDEVGDKQIKKPGVSLEALPVVQEDGYQIALDVSASTVEFEGFQKPKEPKEEQVIASRVMHPNGTSTDSTKDERTGELREFTFDAKGTVLSSKVVMLEKAEVAPIFSERGAKAKVVVPNGQTMVLEMEPRMDQQHVEDRDENDRLISSTIEVYKRRLFVFITAALVWPVEEKK